MHALLLSLLLPTPSPALELDVSGRVFYAPRNPSGPSFFFDSAVAKEGNRTKVTNTYLDLQKNPLLVETTELEDDRIVHYVYKQNQTGDSGSATFENGKIQMTFTEAGKTEHDSETYDPTTIVAPMIQSLLVKNWDAIMSGESIRVRYLAIERVETIGFKFFKDKERMYQGKPVVDILMKPSSFIIAALVDPVRITVMKDAPHWILESDGRTPIRLPKREPPKERSDWKAIDARVEYDAPVVLTPPPSLPPAAPEVKQPAPKKTRK